MILEENIISHLENNARSSFLQVDLLANKHYTKINKVYKKLL
jgi:hypothetical protein